MKRLVSSVLTLLVGVVLAAAPVGAAAADPDCAETSTWVAASQRDRRQAGPITNLRAGRHECYERLVVELDGPVGWYTVEYVPEVVLLGRVVRLRGAAKLRVVVRTSIIDDDGSPPPYGPPDRSEAVDVAGFETFRQVALAGSWESETTIGVGVRERLPFRVLTLDGPGAGSRLVVDVAHAWTGSAAPQGASPLGNFESAAGVAGGVQVKGWMLDPDTPDPWYVWVTVDGAGRHLYANVIRPDVGAAFPGYGSNHGFLGTIPASAGAHRVCVTASHVGPGSHTPLGCRNVSVPDASPVGNFERATGVLDGIEVKGWMADPSSPTTSLYAWVTVDGVGRHLHANQNRPDVAAALPGYGPNHGFLGTIPASPGTHRVCVTAANVGPGDHTLLGCRTVTVAAAASSPFNLTLDPKRCGPERGYAATVTDIRFAQREGFTRVVFDFSGEIPSCYVTYFDTSGDRTLHVIAWFVDTGNPYAAGVFDDAGRLPVGTTSVTSVSAGAMSAGSGEWDFVVNLGVPDRPFHAFTLGSPSRLVVDISD